MTSQVVSEISSPRRHPEKIPAATDRHGLTDRELQKLPPGEHADGKIPGLSFRVRETGGRSWSLFYRVGLRTRRLTLGSYPTLSLADARTIARAQKKAIALGRDPAAEKRQRREADSFGALAERYLEKWAKPRKRSWKRDEQMLEKHVLPRWKQIPVRDIKRRDVRELLENVADRGPTIANRVRALLSKLWNYGISIDVVEVNPVTGTVRNQERARDRVLSEDEIRKLWKATEPRENEDVNLTSSSDPGMPPAMSARLRLPLVTAQRGGEVNSMEWSEINLEAKTWTIPAEKSKNGLRHDVPLSSLALEIIEALPRESEYVLEGARKKHQQAAAAKEIPVSGWSGHDLRRTAASHMASIGINRLVIGKVLNHVERGVTAVYDRHSYDLEKREALTRWSDKLRAILASEPARVVEFKR